MSADINQRLTELLTLFKLPTMAAECARRFRDAGYDAALPVFLETLEAELGERRVRRCDRLLRASHLPPGKSFETLDEKRLPKGVTPRLRELASGEFLERAANVLCFELPGTGKRTRLARSVTPSCSAATPSSSRRRSSSCKSSSRPSAISRCHARSASSTRSR